MPTVEAVASLLGAVSGSQAWIMGASVAMFAWLVLQIIFSRQESRAPKRKVRQGPLPISRASLTEYVTTSPVLLTTEVELATGLGLDISPEVPDLAWAEERARALGIKDSAMLDKLLRENEQLILRFAARFRWEEFHRGARCGFCSKSLERVSALRSTPSLLDS